MTSDEELDGTLEKAKFMELVRRHLEQKDLVKLVLARCHGEFGEAEKITLRPITLRGEPCLAGLFHYPTRDESRNFGIAEALSWLETHLGEEFHAAHLLLPDGDIHAEWSRKGKCRVTKGKSEHREPGPHEHNRSKKRYVDPSRPWLRTLGLMDSRGLPIPSMAHKWKQINKFIEVFDSVFKNNRPEKPVRVLDFGSGKGYLTFALYDYLTGTLGLKAQVTGIEIRPQLVDLCNQMAARLQCQGLQFQTGSVAEQEVESLDVMIALHACHTATDMAIRLGILGHAHTILCSPCCHKEIRPQLQAPDLLRPMLRFGIQAGQQAEMVTDSLRALMLEAHGYSVQLFEFISLEHTDKNKMLSATWRGKNHRMEEAHREFLGLKGLFGIEHQYLEEKLGFPSPTQSTANPLEESGAH